MNRRKFLRVLGLGAIGAAASLELDPERLLWVPGQRRFFIPDPPARVVLPSAGGRNTLLTADIITREALKVFENSLASMLQINRQYFESFESAEQVGRTVNVRVPQRFRVREDAPKDMIVLVREPQHLYTDKPMAVGVITGIDS